MVAFPLVGAAKKPQGEEDKMAHLSGFAGGQHVNDNKCGESVDKLTAPCSERKTIKGVLVALMRPLLTLGVLSMEVRVVEATSCTRHSCHPWLSPHGDLRTAARSS